MAQGRPLESSGRGTGPWIQALRVYQEQREARQAWEAGRKQEGEAEASQGRGQGTTTAKPLEAVVLGPSTRSVPSPKPPGCSHKRPQPHCPLSMGTGATTRPHVSSTCPSALTLMSSGIGPAGPGRGRASSTDPTALPAHVLWAVAPGSDRGLQNPHDLAWGCMWPPPTERQGCTNKHVLTHVALLGAASLHPLQRQGAGRRVGLSPPAPRILTGHSRGTGQGSHEG